MLGGVFWNALLTSFCRGSFCFYFSPGCGWSPPISPPSVAPGMGCTLCLLSLDGVSKSHQVGTAFPHRWAKFCVLDCCPAELQSHIRSYSQGGESRDVKVALAFQDCWTCCFGGTLFPAMNLWTEDFMKSNPHCYYSVIRFQLSTQFFCNHFTFFLPFPVWGSGHWGLGYPPPDPLFLGGCQGPKLGGSRLSHWTLRHAWWDKGRAHLGGGRRVSLEIMSSKLITS